MVTQNTWSKRHLSAWSCVLMKAQQHSEGGKRKNIEVEDSKKSCEMLLGKHDTAIKYMILQQLQLPALDLHKTGPLRSQS